MRSPLEYCSVLSPDRNDAFVVRRESDAHDVGGVAGVLPRGGVLDKRWAVEQAHVPKVVGRHHELASSGPATLQAAVSINTAGWRAFVASHVKEAVSNVKTCAVLLDENKTLSLRTVRIRF